jgi:hypothetical protein
MAITQNSVFKYRIIDNIMTESQFRETISAGGIVSAVSFVSDPSIPYTYEPYNNFNYPTPKNANEIIIFDGYKLLQSTPLPGMGRASGVTNGGRISIARLYNDDAAAFGVRLFHEVTHTLGLNADRLDWKSYKSDVTSFCNYIKADTIWGWKVYSDINTFCSGYCASCNLFGTLCYNDCEKYKTSRVLSAYYTSLWQQAGFFNPLATFICNTTSGSSPLSVKFTNQTKGLPQLRYTWNFGDGSGSTETNPTHTFIGNAGAGFNVTLQASNKFATTYSSVNIKITSVQKNVPITFRAINNYTQNIPMPKVLISASYSTGMYEARTNDNGMATVYAPCPNMISITTRTPLGTKKSWSLNAANCASTYNMILPVGN